jgi:basic membrane protein A
MEEFTLENRTWWWVGGGAVVLAIILFFVFSDGDDDGDATTTIPVAADTTTTEATTTTEDQTTTTEGESTTTTEGATVDAITACQITDTGGIDDKSFNQTAWKGVTDSIDAGYATADSDFLESQDATDYQPNIQAMLDKGCDLIITVGFLLGADTEIAANDNPDQAFQIIDFLYEPGVADNVQGAIFGTTDAAFLAGYLAAGMSETGTVATYGGIQIPCGVTCFMDGFVYGVRYYNEVNGTDVQTLGWNPEDQTGLFTGDFEDLAKGRAFTEQLVADGADVILPVAGPVGEGSAALAQELGNVWVIGVDADWFITLPQYEAEILTSVLKGLDVAVSTAIQAVAEGTFVGGTRLYAIAEDGVGLGPINSTVPGALQDEVAAILEGLKDGSIVPGDQLES